MHNARRRKFARLTGVAVAAAVGLLGIAAVPSGATASVTTQRIAGDNRYSTAAAVATTAYPGGADTVLIASGISFPDALAGSALAARQSAPVLLTDPNTLSGPTSGAIDTLKAKSAVILGGTTAVSTAVENELKKKVTVTRVAGTNRYDTAAKIAGSISAAGIGSTGAGKAALIATGANFADALAGGALAAAGAGGVFPVLLVDSGVPAQTKAALTDLGIKQAVILGGTSVVSASVANELQQITGNAPSRLAGNDRYGTAATIAATEISTFGFTNTAVYLANGLNFADALAGSAFAGKTKTPILLTDPNTLSGPTSAFLTTNKDTVASITAFGGTVAVSDAVLAAAKAAAQGQAGSGGATIAVSPADPATQANDGTATRTYTASGLAGAVDIALVPCDNINDAGAFDNANANAIADGTASGGSAPDTASAAGSISSVNGSPNLSSNSDYADDASPSSGTVTFVVTSPSSGTGCSEPVVFVDANSNDALDSASTAPTTPTEAYGVGGETTYAPAEAADNTAISGLTIQSVDTGDNSFVACNQLQTTCNAYTYDGGDTYQGAATSLSAFEDKASPGDGITGQYDKGGNSIFQLDDSSPAAPGIVSASNTGSIMTVTFSDSSTASVEAYRIYVDTNSAANSAADCSADAADYSPLGSPVADGNQPTYTVNTNPGSGKQCVKVASIDASGDVSPLSSMTGYAVVP